ncbi:hypothetical protein M2146_001180 [Lachnospiraceae bacterium PF1-22]
MSMEEQVSNNLECFTFIYYGCYCVEINPSSHQSEVIMLHIARKMDEIATYGNRGSAKTFMYLFKEICIFLRSRNLKFKPFFRYTKENNVKFNIKCFIEFQKNKRKLNALGGN